MTDRQEIIFRNYLRGLTDDQLTVEHDEARDDGRHEIARLVEIETVRRSADRHAIAP